MTVDDSSSNAGSDAGVRGAGDSSGNLDVSQTVGEPAVVDADPLPAPKKPPRDKGLLIASFVIACGLTLIIWGFFTAITGDEGVDRPPEIESVAPVENAVQVLQQDRVVVDLEFGYEAELIIDGIRLETTSIGQVEVEPGQQLDIADAPTAIFDPGNAIISFQPSEDAAITEFTQGRHQVRVEYWPIDEPDNRSSYNWSFVVV